MSQFTVRFEHSRLLVALGGLWLLFACKPVRLGLVPSAQAQGIPRGMRYPPGPGSTAPAPLRGAQPTPPSPAQPGANGAPATSNLASPAAPSPTSDSALPPSLLQQPAQPATVELANGQLSIKANNSSLEDILHTISSQSGMQVEGLTGDERVFGNFGPGQAPDVLADLFNGMPYNLLIVGGLTNGAPTRLLLSPAQAAAPVVAASSPAASEGDQAETGPPAQPDPGQPEQTTAPTSPQTVKTPQQLFQELQAMKQRQQQQQ